MKLTASPVYPAGQLLAFSKIVHNLFILLKCRICSFPPLVFEAYNQRNTSIDKSRQIFLLFQKNSIKYPDMSNGIKRAPQKKKLANTDKNCSFQIVATPKI
jgi:hypothetical protein